MKNEGDSGQNRHPCLRWTLGLVKKRSPEYADQVNGNSSNARRMRF